MKLTIKRTIIVCFACFGLFLAGCSSDVVGGGVVVDGNPVDNAYNNYKIGGALSRIDDALYYYSDAHDDNNYYLYKINRTATQKIYKYYKFFPYSGEKSLLENNGKLYANYQMFDFVKKKFVDADVLSDPEKQNIEFMDGGVVYYSEKSSAKTNFGADRKTTTDFERRDLYHENALLIKDYELLHIEDDAIYYTQTNVQTAFITIYRFDRNTKNTTTLYSYEEDAQTRDSILLLHATENKILFTKYNQNVLYAIDKQSGEVNEISLPFLPLNSLDHFAVKSINVFQNNIYLCHCGGLTVLNEAGEVINTLSTKDIDACYIMDDKWIYFTVYKDVYRVTKDGATEELVLKGKAPSDREAILVNPTGR